MIKRGVGDVIAELKMAKTAFDGAFLIVEGPSDSSFWRTRVHKDQCQITVAGGKNIVIEVAKALDRENFRPALYVVDDDHDHFLGRDYDSENVIRPETNDLETLLSSSPALQKVIDEITGERRLRDALDLDQLKRIAISYGKLRYVNRQQAFNVDFNTLSPWKYVDPNTLQFNEEGLIDAFAKSSGTDVATVRTLQAEAPSLPEWNVIQGHDFICLLLIAFKGMAKAQASEKTLCSGLRLAYEFAWFKASQLANSIGTWEQRNGHRMLT